MTTQTDVGSRKSFVSARLPWIVAGAAAVVYLLTLNTWLAPGSLQAYARVTRQEWFTEFSLPVFHLVTSPFRWLPETWVPAALNVFSVFCAAIAIGLLARCVALLPQDRTQKQREREQSPFGLLSLPSAWIPPVLACLVCGLQLTFWENATNSSVGMFDLVLFAYSVRCLLEYRISQRESWLLRATVVYAVAMTDTWVLIVLLPAFLASLIWMKGLGFFQLRFLARLFLCGSAGLLFYLYLPLLHFGTDGAFWGSLKENVALQIQDVMYVYRYAPHPLQLLLVLTSVLPILVIGIRWKSQFGDSSPLGSALTTWIFHLTHAVLLGVCIWAAFDAGFSLRDSQGKFSILDANRDRMLPLYFLGALSIGYLTGYFLLVFKPVAQRGYRSGSTGLPRILNAVSVSIVCLVTVLTPIGLLYKNVPQIKMSNGSVWRDYAAALTENLPPHAVVLSDRGDLLLFTRAWLARGGKAADFIFLETHSLREPAYHRFLRARYPEIWPPLTKEMYTDDFRFQDNALIDLMTRLQAKAPLYYLHSSFGGYFEVFYQVPHGLVYELKQYSSNTLVSPPPMSEDVFAENEAFWKKHEMAFGELVPYIAPPGPGVKPTFRDKWMKRMRIPFEKNPAAESLGQSFSRALNALGVFEQRMGRLDVAGKHFAEAQEFSPINLVAAANLDFNEKLRSGERLMAESPESFEERFGNFNGWEHLLNVNGVFDTATGCLAQGIVFAKGSLNRQAAQQFERVLSLAPDNLLGRLWLARTYLVSRTPEKALPLIADLNAHKDSWADAAITPADVLRIELAADYKNSKIQEIRPAVEQLSAGNLLDAAAQTCIGFGDFTNALIVVEKRLEMNPDNVPALVTDGLVHLRMNNSDLAIAPLTRAISLQSTNSDARLFRAVAYLQTTNLDDATLDYETLKKTDPSKNASVDYGLGEIAFRKGDTNGAIRLFELSLSEMPTNSPGAKALAVRINSLKSGTP